MATIIRAIKPLAQPAGSNLCWAAVTAMILGRTGDDALAKIQAEARAAGVPIDSDGRLNAQTGVPALAVAFGFRYKPVTIYLRQAIAEGLEKGACGLFGSARFSWAKYERHAVACHGLVENAEGTEGRVLGVDPRGFTAINMDSNDFGRSFDTDWVLYR